MDTTGMLNRWDGAGWRWWSLAAGTGLVLVTALVAAALAAILDERVSVVLMVALLAELVILSMIGSGMLTGTSRRMSRGGLQRETATLDADYLSDEEREGENVRDRERRDRRTIRMGIMTLPLFVTFLYLLFS